MGAFEDEFRVGPYSICFGAKAHEAMEERISLLERVLSAGVVESCLHFSRNRASSKEDECGVVTQFGELRVRVCVRCKVCLNGFCADVEVSY